jgi:purine-binding chemotaxis protein CheW
MNSNRTEKIMEQLDALSKKMTFGADGSQYLTFALGQEQYGVEILKVQEIKGYVPATPVPNRTLSRA